MKFTTLQMSYGGLQAGNDGLYGTMDDYYETEGFEGNALVSPM